MKKLIALSVIVLLLLCSCSNPSVYASSRDISIGQDVEAVDLRELFLQTMPKAQIKESIYADIDGDGAEDFISLFKLNGKAGNVGVTFSNKTWATVNVAAGENDDMAFIASDSLFVEDGSVGFGLMKSNNPEDIYLYKVKFSFVGNGYDVKVSSKRLEEDS